MWGSLRLAPITYLQDLNEKENTVSLQDFRASSSNLGNTPEKVQLVLGPTSAT